MTRRPATLEDLDAIVAMGERFRSSSPIYATRLAANPDQMRALATRLITDPLGIILVAERDGALVGMLAALIYPHFLSGVRAAGELAWWVDPAARGTIGVRLLKDLERWARDLGAETLDMIAPSLRVERMYEHLGYEPIERTYQRRL
ncbi:MAG TPA: GNAT family N-acetyltransferase [Vicinamibacterales bacterium]|nr:GNAT family N-acetyltransferase [Vicinamibacterales bacterium]